MCRIAAYLGPVIPLERFLLAPPHSLMVQSWAPREMKEANLNADGFGFGWYTDSGTPTIYTNPMPIWTDPNLAGLGRVLSAHQWIAYVRSATRRTDISHSNTQPFHDDELLFTHNGYIDKFGDTLRHQIRHALTTECEKTIHGNTDSEYIFALLRQMRLADVHLDATLRELFQCLEQWAGQVRLLLNFVIADRDSFTATRFAINGEAPSLYYCVDEPELPGAQLIASEPLTDADTWIAVPGQHLLKLTRGNEPVLEPL